MAGWVDVAEMAARIAEWEARRDLTGVKVLIKLIVLAPVAAPEELLRPNIPSHKSTLSYDNLKFTFQLLQGLASYGKADTTFTFYV